MKTSLIATMAAVSIAATAWAGMYDLKEQTPEVAQALNGRQARFGQLAQQKIAGTVGEDAQGHVAQLGGGADVAALVAAENADRETIYQAIVSQNQLPADALATVRQVFGETQRQRAKAGERVQLPSGEWTTIK